VRGGRKRVLVLVVAMGMVLAACGSPESASQSASQSDAPSTDAAGEGGGGTVVVTTSVLGDVVANVVGDAAEVETIMPPGADPHSFEPSAQQIEALQNAQLVVANGGGFEEALVDVLETAEADGVTVFNATDHVELIPFAAEHAEEHGEEHAEEGGEGEHAEGEHAEGEHAEGSEEEHAEEGEHGHAEGSEDPHFFQDPARMAQVVRAMGEELGETVPADAAEAYAAQLDELDAEIEEILSVIPEDRRKLVTNHEAFGYFADRYGFEIVGTVIPGGTTLEDPSAADLEELAATVEAEGVPAIFAENTSAPALAQALANEVGVDVEVVELYSDSLGEPGSDGATYEDMLRSNAQRIAEALE
jgi:ABC-type Zn uptake system ZnuABC Zn-binding protein ZnuA